MAAELSPSKLVCSIKVENGTTEAGAKKLSTINLGALKAVNNPNIDKIFTVADLVAACLGKLVSRFDLVQTGQLRDNS